MSLKYLQIDLFSISSVDLFNSVSNQSILIEKLVKKFEETGSTLNVQEEDLKLHSYRIQWVKKLKPNDLNWSKSYTETILNDLCNFDLLFSAKAHSTKLINTTANIGAAKIPKLNVKDPFIRQDHWALFFEDFRGRTVIVNSTEYVRMLRECAGNTAITGTHGCSCSKKEPLATPLMSPYR